jgi:hypothetical protein
MEPPMDHDDHPITDAEQTRAAALLRMTEDVVAPASLHAAVHAMTEGAASGRARRSSWRPRVLAPAGIALAAIVVAIVVAVAGGGTAPTVGQTARLALAPATAPAPAQDVSDRTKLTVSEAGIAFPCYLKHEDWTATGVRHDTLNGRAVTTVYYRSPQGTRIGYSIVGGTALGYPRGRSITVGGVRYVVAQAQGTRLVTWWRDGHTCVIAGRSVSSQTLLGLARSDERTV